MSHQTTYISVHDCPRELYDRLPVNEEEGVSGQTVWKRIVTPGTCVTLFKNEVERVAA